MRVSQGGHDVPKEKLATRFPRILTNLRAAIKELPLVLVFDNDDLSRPFRKVVEFQQGKRRVLGKPIPAWLKSAIP
jgi:predicted ABC-type ATPase